MRASGSRCVCVAVRPLSSPPLSLLRRITRVPPPLRAAAGDSASAAGSSSEPDEIIDSLKLVRL